ncbi:PREDICTED: uncharacterized protein LOC104789647 [Camelina sativa]|uniref:Uncharacterized protein LOC104789647 n=1 Tax=Camelina sativa TaxID=90675 RepID=A0ABM0ZC50_CAMSA|nr:PREDICTED: uncharacterized protein LOC104789647 [Camelina sativa]
METQDIFVFRDVIFNEDIFPSSSSTVPDQLVASPVLPLPLVSLNESVDDTTPEAPQIQDALFHLAVNSDNPKIRSEAESLAMSETHGIGSFEFLFGMIIWYELLFVVNKVSKLLQSEDMDIDIAIAQLKGLICFFRNYRDTGFQAAKIEAERIAVDMNIDPVFLGKVKRSSKKKRYHDEEPEKNGENVILTLEEDFRINYFIKIVDQGLVSFETRFDQLQSYEKTFGFLFDLKKLKLADDDKLKASCANLEVFLKHDTHYDIDGNDLFLELKLLKGSLPKDIKKVVEVLDFLKQMESCYPNTWTTYRIMMTIPVSVASAERSFSKLKLIKSYLRSTMSQDRLNGLAMMSIERSLAAKLDYETLIDEFATKLQRRMTARFRTVPTPEGETRGNVPTLKLNSLTPRKPFFA